LQVESREGGKGVGAEEEEEERKESDDNIRGLGRGGGHKCGRLNKMPRKEIKKKKKGDMRGERFHVHTNVDAF